MIFTDIHTHIQKTQPNEVGVINLSVREAESRLLSDETALYSIGIHPWEVDLASETEMEKLKILVADSRVRLIGECGLDKFAKAGLKLQLDFFRKQIEFSEQLHKPLIIHCVGCFNELFTVRKEVKPSQKWIIHGFRGKPQLAEQALKAGCDLSFGEKFNADTVQITPLERLFVETDESKISVEEIYRKIAELKQCRMDELIAGNALLNC